MAQPIPTILENILRKMCEFTGLKFYEFDWFNDDKHIKTMWRYEDAEEKFTEWLARYIYSLKISELREITEYPYVYYRRKKASMKFANGFVFNYGFKTYQRDIKEERKNKIMKIMKTYIEWDNTNSQWNDGHITVYEDGEILESFSVDEYFEKNDVEYDTFDLIDILKEKYGIKKFIHKEHNWR